jgi:hypothetical protein
MRAAIYARVSTFEQDPENQLRELRQYTAARGSTAVEFIDRGVSGSKDRRPALDELLKAAKRRKFDVLVCWRLDRLGRNLRHLIMFLDELKALGVAFVTAMLPLRDAILRKASKQIEKRRAAFAVAGGTVSVGRYITGRPHCFITRTKTHESRHGRGKRILKIVVNVGARAGVSADVMFTRGAAAVALVNALEAG